MLVDTCEQGRLAPRDRADAGDLLAQLGDPRLQSEGWARIAAGPFWMGAQSEDPEQPNYVRYAEPAERPVHRVELTSYEISRFHVSVTEYERFIAAGGYATATLWEPEGWAQREASGWCEPAHWSLQLSYRNRPVVGVSWYEASAYARWRGLRLPTEAEWERAARGTEGRPLPWGDVLYLAACNCREAGVGRPTAVGIFPQARTPEGVDDLAGNVWEWCSDWLGAYPPDACVDPQGPATGRARVIRGGAWHNGLFDVRSAIRESCPPNSRGNGVGFRVVRTPSTAPR